MEELENYLIRNNWSRNGKNSYWFTLRNYTYVEVLLDRSKSTATRNAYDRHLKKIVEGDAWKPAYMHKAIARFMENYNQYCIQPLPKKYTSQPLVYPNGWINRQQYQAELVEVIVQQPNRL